MRNFGVASAASENAEQGRAEEGGVMEEGGCENRWYDKEDKERISEQVRNLVGWLSVEYREEAHEEAQGHILHLFGN